MSSDEIEMVAKELTEAQKAFLLLFDLDADETDQLVHVQSDEQGAVVYELLKLGLVSHIRAVFVFAQLTPLGLAIRTHLLTQEPSQ